MFILCFLLVVSNLILILCRVRTGGDSVQFFHVWVYSFLSTCLLNKICFSFSVCFWTFAKIRLLQLCACFWVLYPLHRWAGFALMMYHLLLWVCRGIWIRNCNTSSIATLAHFLLILNLTNWGYLSYILIGFLTFWCCSVKFPHIFLHQDKNLNLSLKLKNKTIDHINDSHME